MIKEYFQIAIKNLKTRSLRSWLTILGVVIGVFLVVALLSLSGGIKNAILTQIRTMGEDVLMVMPGGADDFMTAMMGGLMLTNENIRAIEETEGVDLVVPILWRAETARHGGETKTVFLFGYPREGGQEFLIENMSFYLTQGNWPRAGGREVIVGPLVTTEIFPGMKVGDEIVIEGRKYKVAGVLRSLGNRQDDSMVALDLQHLRQITGIREGAHFASVSIQEGLSPDDVRANIMAELEETQKRARGRADTPPFTVFTREQVSDMVSSIMLMLQVLIFSVASIAVLVGAIGITNTMYTSVRDRTKEIGVMKAVGAKNTDITKVFLIESGIIGLIGGIGGVVLGIGLAKLVELYLRINPIVPLEVIISPLLVFLVLVFSFLIGCASGFLPARRAAKLSPVDALRYE